MPLATTAQQLYAHASQLPIVHFSPLPSAAGAGALLTFYDHKPLKQKLSFAWLFLSVHAIGLLGEDLSFIPRKKVLYCYAILPY